MNATQNSTHNTTEPRQPHREGGSAGPWADSPSEHHSLITSDGVGIATTLWQPTGDARAVVVIASATAVPQRYYAPFAAWLAERGAVVLTLDYRGVGRSRPASLRRYHARMRHWGERDLAAVLRYARTRFSELPLGLVGHSFGGQALALTDEAFHVDRALLVGAQSTPMPHWTWRDRARFMPVLYGVAPVISHVAGYTPGWLGLSEDLPTGVMQEWTRWLRSPGYLFDHVAGASERAAALPLSLEAWAIADDDYAPPPAVRDLVRRFDSAQRQLRDIRPMDVGVRRIGHFGAFRRRFAETLWPQAAAALLDP